MELLSKDGDKNANEILALLKDTEVKSKELFDILDSLATS